MPSFISKNGIWEAAHERVPYTDKDGQPQIYDGPDRAAKEFIEMEGGIVGQDARKDPQLILASRNAGFNNVEDYLAAFAPTPKQIEETKKAQEAVVTHALPKGKPSVGSTLGGFHDDKTTPLQAMEKKQK